jgi:SHOCT-like protein
MTNQEQTKILEMVASGKLTIEQADQLLESLGAQSRADGEKQPGESVLPAGFTNFTGEQMAALEAYEVDADYIRALQEAGLKDLTVKQLIALKDYEVDADDVRARRAAGFTNLTVE